MDYVLYVFTALWVAIASFCLYLFLSNIKRTDSELAVRAGIERNIELRETTARMIEQAHRVSEHAQRAMEAHMREEQKAKYGTFDEASRALAKAVNEGDTTAARAIVDYLNERPYLLEPIHEQSDTAAGQA